MCGISGIVALGGNPIEPTEIEAQANTLIHRGPNQGGVFVSPRRDCGLGIRRLSIIDVAGGRQPLTSEDGSVVLVYNGETYNHRSLRAQLEALGHRPRTHSDGEVVLHGYEAWGAAGILQQMRGMFAFALWDETRRRLVLARDRFGIKPLYTARHNGRLYFASEIKAILARPELPRRVNLAALQALFTVGFVPGPATLFEGIFKLPPAHFLVAEAGSVRQERYWALTFAEQSGLSEAVAVEQFLALLRDSVRLRLMSEVPLGTLLSGGLDSGALTALVQTQLPRRLKTVSIGFDQPGYDESPRALELARFIGTEHQPVTFTARDFDDYPTVMRALEEPQCSATAVPIYRLYQACRQVGLTVVLTGEGADELLGGYHWHQGDALARRLLLLPGWLRRLAAASLPMSAAARRVLARGEREPARRFQHWLEIPGGEFGSALFTAGVTAELAAAGPNPLLASWPARLAELQTTSPLHQMLGLEAQTRMVDFINFEVDKLSMAHSIEARVPYLDHKLWEFCATLPPQFKLKGRVEKYLLRQASRGLLPEATRRRKKLGLAAPYAAWLATERLPDWAEAALSPGALRQAGLFNPETVLRLRRAHRAGQPNLGPLLMGVLSTQVWHELFGQ
ncbi:MAG: Asparagine synthetase [glutamine-hydrolyzing] 1 [Anaerolineae bacterium]|nr:Asparagine synthetase [glutamine-hydrolyzing] 1 [Anaerolineae bacterium]